MEKKTFTVSEINGLIEKKLKMDPKLKNILVKGEISNFKRHQSGTLYFVIKDETVLYAEDSFGLALEKATSNGLEVGTFLIQECTEGDGAYTQTYHSRVIFA